MAQFAIYKTKFRVSDEIDTYNQDMDGESNLQHAQACFAELFEKEHVLKLFDVEDSTRYNNYVWTCPEHDVYLLRLHKSQLKDIVEIHEKEDGSAPECVERQEESNPYCYVIFDNRPGRGQVAIEKSSVWQGDPDKVCVILQEILSHILSQQSRLKVDFLPKMQPTKIWEYYRYLVYEKDDVLQRVSFELDNPDKIKDYEYEGEEISDAIRMMMETVRNTNALKAMFTLYSDTSAPMTMEEKIEDFANMVRVCGTRPYHLVLHFKNHKAYRCDEKVKALIKLKREPIESFKEGNKVLDDTKEEQQEYALVQWLDYVYSETKKLEDAAQIHRPRKGRNKK